MSCAKKFNKGAPKSECFFFRTKLKALRKQSNNKPEGTEKEGDQRGTTIPLRRSEVVGGDWTR